MLLELRISGLGVIDQATLEPGPGLTVVTGETGAGKTMVVTGLGLVTGGRGESRVVRVGADMAQVEARFGQLPGSLAEAVNAVGGHIDDGELLVVRQLSAAGRSRIILGGVQVPAATGAELTSELVTIHGQSEQQRLGTPERQRAVLDRAAGAELEPVMLRYRTAYAARQDAMAELTTLKQQARERAREQDLLQYGLDEIAAVAPEAGEDVALVAESRRLQAVDDLRQAAHRAVAALAGDDDSGDDQTAMSLVAAARKSLETAAESDPSVERLAERAREVAALVADLGAETASYLADLDADPLRLEWIAGRLAALQGLTRKYGENVDEVRAWAEQNQARLADLAGSDERIAELEATIATLSRDIDADAAQITDIRRSAADRLAHDCANELAALALPNARISFELKPLAEPGPHGAESVALLFSANPGSPPGPLAKMASGGELSRVRLALEVVLASGEEDQTFIFDEVDAGVGGAVALEVGQRLAMLARTSQVIVVTHLAQVAAYGDRHFVVEKSDDSTVTTSGLRQVEGEARVAELARMMGGLDESDSSRAHATELLERAHALPSSDAGR